MEYKYCYIFNYSNITINCIHIESKIKKLSDFNSDEEFIIYWGFKPTECSWMFSIEELDIQDWY